MSLAFQLYSPYLWAALVALVVVLMAWTITLQLQLKRLVRLYDHIFAESGHGTFEAAMDRSVGRLDGIEEHVASLARQYDSVESKLRWMVQRIGVVRFNPFNDTGSDQSFAVALLDGNGTGLVISSLFSRTTSRVFVKSVVEGRSTYVLTDEERESIEQAMASQPATLVPEAT